MTKSYKVLLNYGDHILYIIVAKDATSAKGYIKKNFKVEPVINKNSEAFVCSNLDHVFMFIQPNVKMPTLIHEIVHIYQHIVSRLDTNLDEEGMAVLISYIYSEVINKLIEVNLISKKTFML